MSGAAYTDADKVVLKECYTLAEQSCTDEISREVISARSSELRVSRGHADAYSDTAYVDTEMTVISRIMENLSVQPLDGNTGSLAGSPGYALSELPESAEREYLYALLSLAYERGNQQRLDALRHIATAISYDSGDPRFIALFDILTIMGAR